MHWAYKENAVAKYYYLRRSMRHYGRMFEDWLDRLIIMGVIELEDYERELAKVFNVPKCCVEWFIWLGQVGIESQCEYMAGFYGYDDPDEYEYVRCPMCRTNRTKGE